MIYAREVPSEFAARLADLTGVSDEIPHLRAAWEPGRPWRTYEIRGVRGAPGEKHVQTDHRIERWMIYEMIPIGQVSDALREQLDGPAPDLVIRYDDVRRCIMAPEDYAITQTQWKLYRESGRRYFPNPFWCVQGATGGHKLHFTTLEQKFLKLADLPHIPPAPGDLPYAPLDNRVFTQLAEYLRLKQADREFRALRKRDPQLYDKLRKEREKEYRRQVLAFVEAQMAPEIGREVTAVLKSDKLMHGTRAVEVPTDNVDWDRAWEKSQEVYLETGRFPRNPNLV